MCAVVHVMKTARFIYLPFCLFVAVSTSSLAADKRHIGWIENATIYPGNLEFKAKIDTGARTSSINARNITEFTRDGEQWVRFDIINRTGQAVQLELPVERQAIIKRHFGKRQKRFVVKMDICLGNVHKTTEVTLVDREGFIYALLIGRSFLKKHFLIDPSEQFTVKPRCEKTP